MSENDVVAKEQNQYVVPCAIFQRDDEVLLARKIESSSSVCKDNWELPGGTAPYGLSFEDGLKQKMQNYLGTDIEIETIYGQIFTNHTEEETEERHIFVIPAKCRLKNEIDLNTEKFDDYDWFTLEQARELAEQGELVDGDLEFIRMALQN